TTRRTTSANTSPPRSAGSNTDGSEVATPRPTAKSNASTGPCSTSGPTSASTPQMADAPAHLTASFTPTTITAATPPSEAPHPSPAQPTSLGNTASTPRRHVGVNAELRRLWHELDLDGRPNPPARGDAYLRGGPARHLGPGHDDVRLARARRRRLRRGAGPHRRTHV